MSDARMETDSGIDAPRTDEAVETCESHDGGEGGHLRPNRKLEETLLVEEKGRRTEGKTVS